jgi:serralysin
MCLFCGNAFHVTTVQLDSDGSTSISGPISAATPFDIAAIIQQLRTSWGGFSENNTYPLASTNVQYAILTSAPLDSSSENSGWQAMSALMVERAVEAFELWDDLVAISLTQYSGNPPAGASVIQFGYSSTTSGGGTYERAELGVYQGTNEYGANQYGINRAEIWMNSGWGTHSTSSAINQSGYNYYGGYGFITYLHEIGHAMGLSHAGSYNAGTGTITYANSAEYAQDTRRYTIMSYFDADEDGSGTDHYGSSGQWLYAQTAMLHDIAAVQAIYGADTTTRATNTTYGFNSTAGKDVYDFTKNTNPIITIYDAGGIDTLDLSGFGAGQYGGQVINLMAGSWSNVGGYMTNNLAIAYGTVIENAIGGSGNDTISGNAANNTLDGGAGNDSLNGGAGGDSLVGGAGTDVAVYSGLRADYLVTSIGSGQYTVCDLRSGSPDGTDTLTGVESCTFADGMWDLAELAIAVGGVTINGTASDDVIGPGSVPTGQPLPTADSDTLYGLGGNDQLDGGAGADTLVGGAGNDTYAVDNAGDVVTELTNEGTDTIVASLSYTLTANVENLTLAAAGGAINGTGNSLANTLTGNASANVLDGGAGADTLVGGAGNDLLKGGTGVDTGVYSSSISNYTIIRNGLTTIVQDNVGNEGRDVLTSVEVLDFLDADMRNLSFTGDFNGDGRSDIALQNGSATALWMMNGIAVGAGSGNLPTLGAGWSAIGAGDFNLNGTDDLLLQNGQQLALWQMNGATVSTGSGNVGTLGAGWAVTGMADLTGDGRSDILLQNGQHLALWAMNGSSISAGSGNVGTLGQGWCVAGTGDFTGDGRADLLLQNGQNLALWAMNGTLISAGSGSIGTLGAGWMIAGVADFTNDGRSDILLQNGQTLALWAMNGTSIAAGSGKIGTLANGWTVSGNGDFNGDGYADLMLQNGSQVAEWLMHGTNIVAGSGSVGNLASGWDLL